MKTNATQHSTHQTLVQHAGVIRGMSRALTMLLRERRLMLLWNLTVTAAVIYLAVTR
jgi:hypothetical protein